jgi:hypothetical protein
LSSLSRGGAKTIIISSSGGGGGGSGGGSGGGGGMITMAVVVFSIFMFCKVGGHLTGGPFCSSRNLIVRFLLQQSYFLSKIIWEQSLFRITQLRLSK